MSKCSHLCDYKMEKDYTNVLEECENEVVYTWCSISDNKRPSDRYPDIGLDVPLGVRVVLLILAIAGFIMIAVLSE